MKRRETGFSLIELMVAMVITLIVSGAIYGLLSSGQSAFRREPALVDRQQNIRVAMDLIVRDIENGGAGMTPFTQAFTNNLNDPAPAAGSVPSEIFAGQRADFLEILANDGSCPALAVCNAAGVNISVHEPQPACFPLPTVAYVSGTGGPVAKPDPANQGPNGVLFLFVRGGGGGAAGTCDPATPGTHMNAPGGLSPMNPAGGGCTATTCGSVSPMELVRYEIAPDPTDNNNPALWRSSSGRFDAAGAANVAPAPGTHWQVVARGIEDMQIDYQNGTQWPATPAVWMNTPGAVVCAGGCPTPPGPSAADYDTIVRRVRVTLSARAIGANLGGETVGAAGPATAARRGQLTTIVTPRAALQTLVAASPVPNPNPWR